MLDVALSSIVILLGFLAAILSMGAKPITAGMTKLAWGGLICMGLLIPLQIIREFRSHQSVTQEIDARIVAEKQRDVALARIDAVSSLLADQAESLAATRLSLLNVPLFYMDEEETKAAKKGQPSSTDALTGLTTIPVQGQFPVGVSLLNINDTHQLSGIIAEVAKLRHLKRIFIDRTNLWPHELAVITRLPNLEKITMSNTPGIDEYSVELLLDCKNLRTLTLNPSPRFTDKCLETISMLPNLEELLVSNSQIGDELLTKLKDSPSLRFLSVSSSSVTNEIIVNAGYPKQLKNLHISGESLDEQGYEKLIQALPHVQIPKP